MVLFIPVKVTVTTDRSKLGMESKLCRKLVIAVGSGQWALCTSYKIKQASHVYSLIRARLQSVWLVSMHHETI